MDVGFIGVGRMGTGMVANLIKGGHKVWAYDTSEAAMARASQLGAILCSSPREASQGRDAVFLSLMLPRSVEEVVLGPNGVLSASPVPPLLIDTSTMSRAATKRVASAALEKGCQMLDSPIAGGPKGAADGSLTLMVGGPADAFEKAQPLFRSIGKEIFHLGGIGSGHTMKLINNLLHHTARATIAEALMLGTLAGLEPRKIYDVISVSTANSWTFQYTVPRILEGNWEPRGALVSGHKALTLSTQLGEELGLPMPVVSAAKQVYQAAMAAGLGDKEGSVLITLYERLMGVEVRDKEQAKEGEVQLTDGEGG